MKKWVGVLVVILGAGVLAVITLVGLGTYAFVTHVDIEDASNTEDVRQSFDDARRRFSDQTPLLTMGTDGTVKVHLAADQSSETIPETLYVMAWDPDDRRVLTLNLPFWLLRLADDGRVEFDADSGDPFTLDLTVEDLERHGPGLVVDYEPPGDGRVLIWTE